MIPNWNLSWSTPGRSAEEADAQSLRCAILLDELDVPGQRGTCKTHYVLCLSYPAKIGPSIHDTV